MSDLISREALIKKAFTYEIGEKRTAKVVFLSDVQKAKTVDAVEVVRCENCQFWDNEHISSEGLAKCVTGESGIRYRRSYDFCSRGEHKEENG